MLRHARRPSGSQRSRSAGRGAALLGSLALIALSAGWVDAAKPPAGGGSGSFVTFGLAGTPPQAAGTSCPGAGAGCANGAGEPAIRASRDGRFYASSENGLGGGTLAWRSTDGGRHYAS